jgi:hypothetical protein
MIRQVDSSLLDEWEKMRDPNYSPRTDAKEVRPPGAIEAENDITRDAGAFTAAIRTRVFGFLRGLINGDYDEALTYLASPGDADGQPWNADRLHRIMQDYQQEHRRLCLDPEARNRRHTYVMPADDQRSWRVQQMLVDPEGDNDWVAEFETDLPQSRARGEPILQLRRIGSLGLRPEEQDPAD